MKNKLVFTTQKIFMHHNTDIFNTIIIPLQLGVVPHKIGANFTLIITNIAGDFITLIIKNNKLHFYSRITLKTNGKIYKNYLKTTDFILKFSLKYQTEDLC